MLTKKSMLHRILAVFLSLFMVLFMLPEATAAGESLTYTAVTTPTSGKNYIIAVTDGTTAHAIDNSSMQTESNNDAKVVAYVDLLVSSGVVTTDNDCLVWTVTKSGSDWQIRPAYGDKTSSCLYPGTSDKTLYLNTTQRAWKYNESKLSYKGASTCYLQYNENSGFSIASTGSTITFYELIVEATGISLSQTAAAIAQNDTLPLTATLSPADAIGTVTWESSDDTVATVTDGVVTGLKAGIVDITATVNSHSATCMVTVSDAYKLVDTITSGEKYLITSEYEGLKFALDTTVDQGYLNSSGYSYSGFTGAAIDTIKEDMVWIITASENGYNIFNSASKKYLDSTYEKNESGGGSAGALFLTDVSAEWTYSDSSKIFTSVTSKKDLKYDTDALGSSATAIDGQTPNILFTIRSDGAAVKLYQILDAAGLVVTNAPAFSSTSCAMTSSTDDTAVFPLTNNYSAPTFKVYASSTDIEEAAGVAASLDADGSTLTLTFSVPPTSDVTYYISATEADCLESARIAVAVKAYTAPYTYTQVNTITSGKTYLIVVLNDSKYVAMKGETDSGNTAYDYLNYTDVTANKADTTITLDTASAAELEWVLTGSDAEFTMYNNSAAKYAALNNKSGNRKYGMTLADSGQSWTYSDGQFKYTGVSGTEYEDNAYLYSSTTTSTSNRYEFRANTDSAKASTIYLYEKQVLEADYLAFTSDVHFKGSINNLQTWLNKIDETTLDQDDLDYMGFCGDMASASVGSNTYWSYVQTMIDTVAGSSLIDDNDNGIIYTTGNHEYSPGSYGSVTNTATDRITRIGKAVETDNFLIYCFGAADGNQQQFTKNDRDALDSYLNDAPEDIPIIILSHYPIHYYSGRTTAYAVDLINVLNEHPNVIFLWGHNHSVSDPNYGKILTADSSIQFTNSSSDIACIKFNYAAAGCMSDIEYSGGSGNVKQKGMIMEVAPDGGSVTMTYYGLDGNAVGNSETVTINKVSSNARLSSLSYTLNGVTKAVPDFSPSGTNYSIVLPSGTIIGSPITLEGKCSSKDAIITENAGAVWSDDTATAVITVTAEDGATTQTYTVQFTALTTEGTVFVPADGFTDGGEYIIAFVDNGTAYCLDADNVSTSGTGSSTALAATESVYLNTITTSDESIIWSVSKSGSSWYISPTSGSNTARKLYMGNGPTLYLDSSGRAMEYNGSIILYTSSRATYYLAYSDGRFAASTSSGSPIQLFTRAVNGISLSDETLTVKKDRTVQLAATLTPVGAYSPIVWSVVSGSEYASVDETGLVTGLGVGTATISATANGYTDTCEVTVTAWPVSDSVFLAFTSDTHYESGKTNNLDNWLNGLSDLYHTVDYMGICGDIGSTSSSSVDMYWNYVQDIVDTVNKQNKFVTNGGIYLTGNHEMYKGPTAGGDYDSAKSSNSTAMLLTQTGEAVNTNDYIIYAFGAYNNVTSSTVQEFTEAQISALNTYLDSVPDNIPIFIMSHYPLHYDGKRYAERAEDVIAILNEHPNVLFLWGHHHTDVGSQESGYDNILKAGAQITTLNNSGGTPRSTQINFTYAPAGCMSDAEYSSDSAKVLGKGMIVEVSYLDGGGKNVTMAYYNLAGKTFSVEGKATSASVCIDASSTNTYTLSVTAPAFDDVQYGYAQPAAKALTITSTGNTDATISSVISDSTSFIISGTGDNTVPYGTSITSWTVQPMAGLTVGTYEATITVTYNDEATATALVNLTVLKADQAAPSSSLVVGVNPASPTDKGSITGVTTAMEYRKSGDSDWTACTGTSITDLEPGSYNVRYAGTDTLNPGPEITITIIAYTSSGGPGGGGSGDGGSSTDEGDAGVQTDAFRFTDVLEGVWYYDAVRYVTEKGMFSGTSDTTFAPETPMSRAMLVTVLYRIDGKPVVNETNPFTDVPAGMWYTDAIIWARHHGIVSGFSAHIFKPDLNVSREQLAVILYNFAKYKGYDMTLGKDFDLRAFSDASQIADYAKEALKWACDVGIIKGKPGNLIDPKGSASRAEVATILERFDKYVEDSLESAAMGFAAGSAGPV